MNHHQLTKVDQHDTTAYDEAVISKVMLNNDLSPLKPSEKVMYLKRLSESLDLNYLTKPIQIISFKGKEIPYFTKNATEQMRQNQKVSITKMEQKVLEGGIYVVTVHASMPDGRTDAATGAISISGLKGEDLCNAMLKAETKAKRRVTLSICGAGLIDESEAESIQGAQKINIEVLNDTNMKQELIECNNYQDEIDNILGEIYACDSLPTLQSIFNAAKKLPYFRGNDKNLELLIAAKDKRKTELIEKGVKEFNDEIDQAESK